MCTVFSMERPAAQLTMQDPWKGKDHLDEVREKVKKKNNLCQLGKENSKHKQLKRPENKSPEPN